MKSLGREITSIKDFFLLDAIWLEIPEIPYYVALLGEFIDESIVMSLNKLENEKKYTLYWGERAASFNEIPNCWEIVHCNDEKYKSIRRGFLLESGIK